MPKVFIIILNWKGLRDTLECLESVYQLDYPNFEVIVVDNYSGDSSCEVISRHYPQLKMFSLETNLGFTGGNNVAIEWALKHGADYVWLLNNDTEVHPAALSQCVARAEANPQVGLVSPVVLYFEDQERAQFCGSYVNWKDFTFVYSKKIEIIMQWQEEQLDNMCLWGTALLVRRSLIEKIGYLADDYFAYWEDTEYSLRSIRSGFLNILCTEAKIYHKVPLPETVKFQRRPHYYYYMTRNKMFLNSKYLRSINKIIAFKNILEYTFKKYIFLLRSNDHEVAEAYLDGIWNALLNKGGAWCSRYRTPPVLVKLVGSKIVSRWILKDVQY